MRRAPDADAIREAALSVSVREAIGTQFRFLEDGPDLASVVLAELWSRPAPDESRRAVKAFCAVMAMATDAIRGARATLLVGDFGGVFLQLRRADELQTLAVSIGRDPAEAERWLAGSQVSQRELRGRIEKEDPQLAAAMRTTFEMLSNEAHGRAQALAAYENRNGVFDWPPHQDTLDAARVRASFMTTLAFLMVHFGTLRWILRGWENASPEQRLRVDAYDDALVDFVLAHQPHGDWHAIAPGHAAEWLGIGDGAVGYE